MHIAVFLNAVLILPLPQYTAADPLPEHVKKYLDRCAAAKDAAIKLKEKEIATLSQQTNPTRDVENKLQAARRDLKNLQEQPAPRVRLPLPPEKGDAGIFETNLRLPRSVDILEVVDESDLIIRAWYLPDGVAGQRATAEDATFVDLWVQGIDTRGLAAKSSVTLRQVFQVIGAKVFDTTCGKRSVPLLEPLDIERYLKTGEKRPEPAKPNSKR